jgi:hypothetical protein
MAEFAETGQRYTRLFEIIVRNLTTCDTQYTGDRSILLYRWIKKFSTFSFMVYPRTEGTNQNRH